MFKQRPDLNSSHVKAEAGPRKEMYDQAFMVATLEDFLHWGQSYSLWTYPFATACCGIEYMAAAASDYDIARFGAERPSFSPRQADLIMVLGTITYKMAPVLRHVYKQLAEPRYVISVGACASSGGMFHSYSVLQGVDRIIPVDAYVPGCPPRPEGMLQALQMVREKVKKQSFEERRAEVKQKIIEMNKKNKALVVE